MTSAPLLSVVVVAYEMGRELPRTLRSLDPRYQQGIAADDYEVIVVDNGSSRPVDESLLGGFAGRIRSIRIGDARPTPARAANEGISAASADLVGLLIDGARIASPGLLAKAVLAARLAEAPLIAALGWHLGPTRQMSAAETGYDSAAEDQLLADTCWEDDGYRLFSVSTLAASSSRGWFGPMGESNSLFMRRSTWDTLGGLDTSFALPGGGLSNHDLYRRACGLDGVQLIVLLGEGTFHQIHGGAATSGRIGWEEMNDEYEALRGHRYTPPPNVALYLGTMPEAALPHAQESVRWALEQAVRRRR